MQRTRRSLTLAGLALAVAPAAAPAAVPHLVAPGETLWGLASAQNMTTRAFAAANGLQPDAAVIAGRTMTIPTVDEAAFALSQIPAAEKTTAAAPAAAAPAAAAPAAAAPAAASPAAASTAPPALGGYTVRPGDTISGLAASSRIPAAQFAQMNGLDTSRPLLTGTVVKLPTGAPAPAGADRPAPAPRVAPAAPAAAPGRVTSGDIAAVAGQHGVSGSLASAVAWQESGFNNAKVSSANARGVMQVMPGTWDWIQSNLTSNRLDPASPRDNVRAGVLYLRSLLRSTNGDPSLAVASYYQGLSSVSRIGMLPETRRYVDNVMALRGRFGG